MSITSLLLLADGRFPSGGHAHSGGLEAAVTARRVTGVDDLGAFLRGRLATAGLVSSAFAAAACYSTVDASSLDAGLDARTPSPALRRASRAQGRALLRAARQMWPLPPLPASPHQPVALGVVAAAAGLDHTQAALAAAYGTITGPASAAVRLLGLDPYRVHALLAGMATDCETVAARAAAHAGSPVDDLPAASAPLLDAGAEIHARWEVRLFAS
ncbi:urease accessory protein UreF [Phytohabitans aurantiacus]|jgi:urease accessory protein|uniref:Urease accessory protein UreF n=1 Tax=Phytohabitans aurantiacus TaxID=3016789 RepID=A0ABQ5R5C9_9ACTN|nr:urease accessory UreF family protein [Phytohabitans aurantiacus]GLI01989.1 urease accessory protein UreF [Phytohabitans aurantiacus]